MGFAGWIYEEPALPSFRRLIRGLITEFHEANGSVWFRDGAFGLEVGPRPWFYGNPAPFCSDWQRLLSRFHRFFSSKWWNRVGGGVAGGHQNAADRRGTHECNRSIAITQETSLYVHYYAIHSYAMLEECDGRGRKLGKTR